MKKEKSNKKKIICDENKKISSKKAKKEEKMQKYLCFLRGINIGNKRMKMTELKEALNTLGYSNIETYIQTGNIVFESNKKLSNKEFEKEIENSILEVFEFEVPNVVIKKEEYQLIVEENPFLSSEKKESNKKEELYLTLFCDEIVEKNIELESTDDKDNQYFIKNNVAYLFISKSYSKSKINNSFFEKKLKINATSRNWKTIKKMLHISLK
jgi:uncharacterized protein (DUF1697 family)